MNHLPQSTREALELKYNGPIPTWETETPAKALRRQRGTLSLLERQASEFLDAAERAIGDAEEFTTRFNEPDKSAGALKRADDCIRHAAEAMYQAIPLRESLGLPSHPIVAMMSAIYGRLDEAAGKGESVSVGMAAE